MSELTDKLEQIAQGIDALPESLSKQFEAFMQRGNLAESTTPKLPSASPASAPNLNRAVSPPPDDSDMPSLPKDKPAKSGGGFISGLRGFGHAMAQTPAIDLFKGKDEKEKDRGIGGQRGGLQSKTQDGGVGGEGKEMVRLLGEILKALQGKAGSKSGQDAPTKGRETQLFMRGGKTQIAGNNLSGIHGKSMAGGAKINVRPGGAGGGNANPQQPSISSKIASIFG